MTAEKPVIVWTKPACTECDKTKAHLEREHIPFKAKDITAPEHADDLKRLMDLGFRGAPVVEYGELRFAGNYFFGQVQTLVKQWATDHLR
jgi:glutaredoxin